MGQKADGFFRDVASSGFQFKASNFDALSGMIADLAHTVCPTSPPTNAPTDTIAPPPDGEQPVGVSGDPFVVDQKGTKVQFFLPLQEESLLLTCKQLQLYGRTMGTG
eukprot:gene3542-7191_t